MINLPIKVPPIKSQGIKTKLVAWIADTIERGGINFERWVEPFMGTCVVPLNMRAKHFLLSDKNPYLVDFYVSVKKGIVTSGAAKKFLQKAGQLLSLRGEDYYYELRERFNQKHDPFDFLFLNRACFNGMMRFNRNGKFNVPFCKKNNRFRDSYITKICNQIQIVSEFFKYNNVNIINSDYKNIFSQISEKDLIYCDPPYIDRYVDYYGNWSENDEENLFNLLRSCGNFFILSTWHHNKFRKNIYIEKFWHRFNILTRKHFYHLGGSEINRHEMVEALVTNIMCGQVSKKSEYYGCAQELLFSV